MSPAHEILAEMGRLGLSVSAHEGRIRFAPKSAMTAALAERIKQHRTELLALLQSPAGVDAHLASPPQKSEQLPRAGTDNTDKPVRLSVLSVPRRSDSAFSRAGETAELTVSESTHPQRACAACLGRAFHRVATGPMWICSTCHAPHELDVVVERWIAPHASAREAIDHGRALREIPCSTFEQLDGALCDERERPQYGCWRCGSQDFHLVATAPSWICARCWPSEQVIERWTAPHPSRRTSDSASLGSATHEPQVAPTSASEKAGDQ